MSYLWSHHPWVSSPPCERLKHKLFEGKKGEIDEMGVFKLENGKYLYIRFCGNKQDLNVGYTDIDEFEDLTEAESLFINITE